MAVCPQTLSFGLLIRPKMDEGSVAPVSEEGGEGGAAISLEGKGVKRFVVRVVTPGLIHGSVLL